MNEEYCLWMGDIEPIMDESTIYYFFQFYNVYPLSIKLINDKETKQNKKYCFIYFNDIFEASNALIQLKGKPIPNTSLKFKLNWANYFTSSIKTIFVGNLNPLVNDEALISFFRLKYKSTSKAKIILENGKSKRYGFVTFKKGSDYRKSLVEMNGVFFGGTYIKVREYKRKDEDENNIYNNTQNLDNNTNNQSKLNIEIINYKSNNEGILSTNNLNSNNLFSISNSTNRLNWTSNANPINGVSTGINKIINSNNYNKNRTRSIDDSENNNSNFNNSLKGSKEYNNLTDNNINNINNATNGNNIIINNDKINRSIVSKKSKLEIFEELDEITLKIKINESLNKMLEYYKENILTNGNRLVRKLILYLIFI